MSGGSYNYLCYKDSSQIQDHIEDINDMRDRLTELGYLDAAKETESVLLIINTFEVRVNARIDRLKALWRAVEWCDSGDTTYESVKEEIEKYRNL